MTHGRSEFPVRISLPDLKQVLAAGQLEPKEQTDMYMNGLTQQEITALTTIRGLHAFLLARRTDPGFQVVLGE